MPAGAGGRAAGAAWAAAAAACCKRWAGGAVLGGLADPAVELRPGVRDLGSAQCATTNRLDPPHNAERQRQISPPGPLQGNHPSKKPQVCWMHQEIKQVVSQAKQTMDA